MKHNQTGICEGINKKNLHKNLRSQDYPKHLFCSECWSYLPISQAIDKQFQPIRPKLAEKIISLPSDDPYKNLKSEIINAKFES